MANANVDTGHGASISFGTSSEAFNWTAVKPPKETREPIGTEHLASTKMTKMPGDLSDYDTCTVEFQFDSEANLPTTDTAAQTITITWPQSTGQTAPATYAGTGMITGVDINQLQTGELQTGSMDISFDCQTGPTFTKATTGA
jgi:hypothetical protein